MQLFQLRHRALIGTRQTTAVEHLEIAISLVTKLVRKIESATFTFLKSFFCYRKINNDKYALLRRMSRCLVSEKFL